MDAAIIDDVINWVEKRPNWIIDTVNHFLVTGKQISDDEIQQLAEKCLKEANSTKVKKSKINREHFHSYFGTVNVKGDLKLKSISNIKGINELNPKSPLDLLSDNITVVYGRNGSGKTGYSRIIKSASGNKNQEKLLCDVFTGIQPQQCDFELIKNGNPVKITWKPEEGMLEDLLSVDVFDSSSGISYVMDERQVTYEPQLLKFISYLIKIADAVNDKLSSNLLNYNHQIPIIPIEYKSTKNAEEFYKIKLLKDFKTKFKFKWSRIDAKQLKDLQNELSEAENKTHLAFLKNQINNRTQILEKIIDNNTRLHSNKLSAINRIKKEIAKNRKDILVSEQILQGQRITGVSSDLFKKLWNSAKEFSENEVYQGESFPYVKKRKARCVLCQQEIGDEARLTLTSLDEFIKNKFNEDLVNNENALESLFENLSNFWNEEYIEQLLSNSMYDAEIRNRIKDIFNQQVVLSESFKVSTKTSDLHKITDTKLITELKTDLAKFNKKYSNAVASATSSGLLIIKDSILELNTKKWLSENKSLISIGLKNEDERKKINIAKGHCNSGSFTIKKSALAKDLVTKVFLQRFEEELEELGAGYLKVTIEKESNAKGNIKYSIKLKGNAINERIENVLSEGENRIVALAGFLADVADKPFNSPFIFDDPISSLDAEFEEECVKRLIKLSEDRQVIVFTHRLSLLSQLIDEAKEQGVDIKTITVESQRWGKGEPDEKNLKNLTTALNNLLNPRLSTIKNEIDSLNNDDYLYKVTSITSEFRVIVEKAIEDVLLNEVVSRYRKNIITNKKLKALIKIEEKDTKLFQGFMTKYSKGVHSHSDEIVAKPPSIDIIEKDIITMRDWIKDFKDREPKSN